jgi:hypothetical protein
MRVGRGIAELDAVTHELRTANEEQPITASVSLLQNFHYREVRPSPFRPAADDEIHCVVCIEETDRHVVLHRWLRVSPAPDYALLRAGRVAA